MRFCYVAKAGLKLLISLPLTGLWGMSSYPANSMTPDVVDCYVNQFLMDILIPYKFPQNSLIAKATLKI